MELGGEGKRQTTFLSVLEILCCLFGEGNGNPLQYYCLENPMDREAWQATVREWGCGESDTAEKLSTYALTLLVHLVSVSDLLVGLYMRHRWRMLRIPNGILRLLAKCFVF